MDRLKIWKSLYLTELHKIFGKRYVQILFVLTLAAAIYLNVTPYLRDTKVLYLNEREELVYETMTYYRQIQLERQFAAEYSGQVMDEELLDAARESYKNLYEAIEGTGRTDCSGVLLHEFLIFYMLDNIGTGILADQEAVYALMEEQISARQDEELQVQKLSEEAVRYWEAEQEQTAGPYVMGYTEGYGRTLKQCFAMNMLTVIFVLVSLCSSFSDDEIHKIRPLLSATRHGHKDLLLARLAACESLAVGTSILLLGLTALIQFGVCGADGFQTLLRFVPYFGGHSLSRNITAGQAVGIGFGICLLLSVMMGAIAPFLSACFGRAVPALASSLGFLLLTLMGDLTLENGNMFRIDSLDAYRYSQIESFLPFHRVSGNFLLDQRLISIGSLQLDWIPACIILYGGLTAAALLGCAFLYKKRCVER